MEEAPGGKIRRELDLWKSKFLNETELRMAEVEKLQKQLAEAEEDSNIYSIEAEEVRKQNKKLLQEIENLRNQSPQSSITGPKSGYMEQLELAQQNLLDQNAKISQLLAQIDLVKETESKQQELEKQNEELEQELEALELKLAQKEKEIKTTQKKEHLTSEMNSMLDNAYNEFSVLQEKMQKLEAQVMLSNKINMEHQDLKESYYKINNDFEELKQKHSHQLAENRRLYEELTETEDKLKESNFQRQQLQKKVNFLEEINSDMQAVADANKKLENQLKRIGELESMLNVISEERDMLAKKTMNP